MSATSTASSTASMRTGGHSFGSGSGHWPLPPGVVALLAWWAARWRCAVRRGMGGSNAAANWRQVGGWPLAASRSYTGRVAVMARWDWRGLIARAAVVALARRVDGADAAPLVVAPVAVVALVVWRVSRRVMRRTSRCTLASSASGTLPATRRASHRSGAWAALR